MAIFNSSIPSLSTSFKINDVIYRVRFIPRDKPYNYGIYATSDKDLIAAIRKHPNFGTIITEQPCDSTEPVTEERVYDATYPEVTKSQDAKTILAEKYNVEAAKLRSKADIHAKADELNISFPNL